MRPTKIFFFFFGRGVQRNQIETDQRYLKLLNDVSLCTSTNTTK
jgi:hypothetical protein